MTKLITKLCLLKNILTVQKLNRRQLRYSSNLVIEKQNKIIQESKDSEPLIAVLRTDINPYNIIANLKKHKTEIDGRHLTVALSSLNKFYKTCSTSDIAKKSVYLEYICSILNTMIPKLDLPEVIESIKLLSLLDVSSSSMLMQKLMQVIRYSINDLDVNQICFLSFLLTKLKQTNLSKAIFDALPDVFTAQLEIKLNTEDIDELVKALKYASMFVTDEKAITYILDTLDRYETPINMNHTISIFNSLCRIGNSSKAYLNVLLKMHYNLQNNKSELEQLDISIMLKNMLTKISLGNEEFYNPPLINMLITIFINNNGDFDQGTMILNSLNKIRYINMTLLTYLIVRCYKNQVLLESQNKLNVLVLSAGMSIANYYTNFWNKLQHVFVKHCKRLPDDTALGYFIFYLATLDYFDTNLLKYHFSINHNVKLLTKSYLRILQQIYQSVKILYPTYEGPLYSEEVFECFKTLEPCEIKNNCLFPLIEKVLGDPCYIKRNVKLNLGLIIDNLIIYENKNPLAIESKGTCENDKSFICEEDLIIPSNSTRIAVLLLQSSDYNRNVSTLSPSTRLKIKLLEAMSYRVVQVSNDIMNNIPDFERMAYISDLIKEKMEEN